jgi:hypothetical protein
MPEADDWRAAEEDEVARWFGPRATTGLAGLTVYRPPSPEGFDGPTPVALVGDGEGVLRFALATLDPDWPGPPDDGIAVPGAAMVDAGQLAGLVALLGERGAALGGASGGAPELALERLDEAALAALGLDDEVFERHRQTFHLQRRPQDAAALVTSMIEPLPADSVDLQIRALDGSDVFPPADAPELHLDAAALDQLLDVLRGELAHLRG